MPIVSTQIEVDNHTQKGGSRYVVERHTDHLGNSYMVGPYLAQPGFDYQARAQSRALELEEQLAEMEVTEALNNV